MTLRFIKRTAIALLLGLGVCHGAFAGDTPDALSGAKLASADDVLKLQREGAVLVDSRVASEYAEGHIKGAINVPYREKSEKTVGFDAAQDEFNLGKLPADKAAPLVIYCNGPECWKSYKASTAALKAGYSQLYWYREGYPNWKSKGFPSE
jgi:rhodanese-related sulfurtransferase